MSINCTKSSSRRSQRPNTVYFFLNKRAGTCRSLEIMHEARRQLMGFDIEFCFPNDLNELNAQLSQLEDDQCLAVVVVGGDGSVNCALPALTGRDIPLYPFPAGTANDLASYLGTRRCFRQMQNLLAEGRTRKIDLIEVNHSINFATVGGIGVGTVLTQQVNSRRKRSAVFRDISKLLQQHVYSYMGARTILTTRKYLHRVLIKADNFEETLDTGVIMICNQPFLGGDLNVAPETLNDDGTFNVFVVWSTNRQMLLKSLLDIKRGNAPPNAYQFETDRLEIEDLDGKAMGVFGDGESLIYSPKLSFRILPKALTVYETDAQQRRIH